jgi:V8-like Glu-specific endopeptidase
MRLGLCLLVSMVLGGCALSDAETERTGTAEQPKIIGTNDLVPVLQDGANIPVKYAGLVDGFGRLSNGCTATHIGNGLAITAGHCFNSPSTRKDNSPCSTYSVAWGFRKDDAAYLTSKCQVILAGEQSRNRDYAIFVVRPIPPVTVAIDWKARPAVNTPITIFSHPRSRPLEWSQLCSVQPNTNGGWGSDMFSHQCDTEPGSSGASVLDDATLKVIGIHDGGIVPWNYATFFADTPIDEFVNGYNVPPTVAFTAPTASTVTGVITVSADVTDLEDGTAASVSVKLPDGTTTALASAPYTLTFDTSTVANGSHKFEITATDSAGATTTTTKSIRVNNPVATAPAND